MSEAQPEVTVVSLKDFEPVDEAVETQEKTELTSTQELSGRTINPIKLMALLRVKFGIGRYEISVWLPS